MINPYQPPADLRASQVIDSQVCAALILVLEPPETFALTRLLVAHELEEDGLAELREDGDHVAFRELVRQAAEVDVSRVAVVDVPGRVGRAGEDGCVLVEALLVRRGGGGTKGWWDAAYIPASISRLLSAWMARIWFILGSLRDDAEWLSVLALRKIWGKAVPWMMSSQG